MTSSRLRRLLAASVLAGAMSACGGPADEDTAGAYRRMVAASHGAVVGFELPDGAVPAGHGLGGESRYPATAEDAVEGRKLNPLRELLCLGSCPAHWEPADGVLVARNFDVPGASVGDVCDQVQPVGANDADPAAAVCRFQTMVGDTELSITAAAPATGAVTLRVEAITAEP